jgi:phosphatidylinositol dimannoside acyltransferase
VKDLLGYVLFRFAAAAFGLLPESWMRNIGESLGRAANARKTTKRNLLEHHMRRVLGDGSPESEVQDAVKAMYESYGRYWAETFWVRPRRHDAVTAEVERIGFSHIDDAMEAGKGMIFALPHMGNWEIAGLVADEIGARALAVAEHLSNERITNWFVEIRNQLGIDIVLTSDPQRNSKLIRTLKAGKPIALLADRDVTGRGLETQFFGEVTRMPAGPIGLADMTGASLLPVGVYFKKGAGHRIVVHPPIVVPDIQAKDARIAAGAALMAAELEKIILESPGQWHLFQPNWPSDPGFRS